MIASSGKYGTRWGKIHEKYEREWALALEIIYLRNNCGHTSFFEDGRKKAI